MKGTVQRKSNFKMENECRFTGDLKELSKGTLKNISKRKSKGMCKGKCQGTAKRKCKGTCEGKFKGTFKRKCK